MSDDRQGNTAGADDVTYAFWLDAPGEILNEIEAAWREITDGPGFRTGLWFSYGRKPIN